MAGASCSGCGAELPAKARFCPACGAVSTSYAPEYRFAAGGFRCARSA